MQGVAAANAEVVASVSAFVAAEGYVAEEMVFIMFVPDLEELAHCSGDVVVLSKEVAAVALGDAADLSISCGAEACLKSFWQLVKTHTLRKEDPNTHPTDAEYQATTG